MPVAEKKKRILIVCQHFWPETFRINDIADFFANEKGCEVEVLCGLPNYPSGKLIPGYSLFKNRKQVYKNIRVRRVLEIPRGNNSSFRIFLNYISFPFFSLFHIPYLLTQKYDQILLYQLSPVMMSVSGLIVGKIKKIPTTMYVLDLWPENLYSVLNIKNKLLRKIVATASAWHYKKADKLIALSETMRQRLVEVTGKKQEEAITLPQTCEKIYEQSVDHSALSKRFDTTFNIVYAGNISPAQSLETIINSAEIVINSGIKNIRWIILGDGMSRRYIESIVLKRKLSNYIVFEGQKPIEEIPTYTHIADAFVGSLVRSDLLEATIPAKVISYIASGKPILLAMDGEVQELINRKIRCGYASQSEDSVSLAHNTCKLYALSERERKTFGENAKKYYFKHFERAHILNKLHNFIFTTGKV